MKYIEENGNITKEYAVTINDEELERIVNELDEKLSIAVKASVNVSGTNKDEAIFKINSINKSEVNIISQRNLNDVYSDMPQYSKPQYLFECEYFCKKPSGLSYILHIILDNYRENRAIITKDSQAIERLLEYANSDELIPYQERMARDGITKEVYDEYENNKDFDFELLKELYQRALECFELKLVSVTEKTTYDEKDAKVYKFGTR